LNITQKQARTASVTSDLWPLFFENALFCEISLQGEGIQQARRLYLHIAVENGHGVFYIGILERDLKYDLRVSDTSKILYGRYDRI